MVTATRTEAKNLAKRLLQGGADLGNVIERAATFLLEHPAKTVMEALSQHHETMAAQIAELEIMLRGTRPKGGGVDLDAANDAGSESVADKVRALQAAKRWEPGESDLMLGRRALLEEFERPENLRLPAYVKLAGKSRQQIYKDIAARRLLALSVGPRRQRIPEWQLEPKANRLTQLVLEAAPDVDSWTLYQALTRPMESLSGKSPIEAVLRTKSESEAVAAKVCAALGVRPEAAG